MIETTPNQVAMNGAVPDAPVAGVLDKYRYLLIMSDEVNSDGTLHGEQVPSINLTNLPDIE